MNSRSVMCAGWKRLSAAVARSRRPGETASVPVHDLGSAVSAGVIGVLACSVADKENAVRLLGGVRALVRSLGESC